MDIKHIQLIAIDLDGTLLNSQKICSVRTQNTIKTLLNTNRKVCFITGRSIIDTTSFANQCGLSEHLIVANGAYIWDIQNQKAIKQTVLDIDIVADIIHISRSHKAFVWLYDPQHVYYELSNDLSQAFIHKYPKIEYSFCNFDHIDHNNILKSLFLLQKDKAQEIRDLLHQKYTNRINTIFTNPHLNDPNNPTQALTYLEVLHSNSNKGNALQHLCEYYNISLENTLVFGDEDNDLEMLKIAGISVAMGNANKNALAVAKYTTLTNDEDGVADFIEKHLL